MGFYEETFTGLPHDLIPQDAGFNPELFDLQNSIDCANIRFIIKCADKCCNLKGLGSVMSGDVS
jgi:hypothetical protein